MKSLAGQLVLITGGGSGIGKIMARLCLERGARVVLWDRNAAAMEAVVTEFSRKGDISGQNVDVADASQVEASAKTLIERHGGVDVLINNAGIVVGKHFHDHSVAEIQRTIDINTTAPMLIARAFLPGMIARGRGHICNIASSAGLVANPKMSVYAASKWALVGWSESLRVELARLGHDIKVTAVLPYYIGTGMFDGVESRLPILEPEKAALAIVRAIERDKRLVTLPGYIYRLTRLSQGLLSLRLFDWLASSVFGIYKTMDGFRGRG